jgi:octaprenyl-diphosphate synthase
MYAAEFLHRALAVHDIALGRQGGKRRWLVRKVAKRSAGLLAGNHLTLRALELTRHSQPEVLGELVDTLRAFSDGQALLRDLQQGGVPTQQDWLEHADAHTGALFAFCCRAGAWLAEAERPRVTALGRYGRHLGRLWHIAEDVSMLEHGDAGAHLVARALAARPILAVALAAEADPEVGALWAHLVRNPSAALGDTLALRLGDTPGIGLARERMAHEAWSARKVLTQLEDSRYRRALDRLVRNLVRSGLAPS